MTKLLEVIKQPVDEWPTLSDVGVALESVTRDNTETHKVFILLTDTNTRFAKVSKLITKDPYNHVSIAFDADLENIYTYALRNVNGLKGGLKKETLDVLKGSRYSLYEMPVTEEVYDKVVNKVLEMEKDIVGTGYNHLSLINAVFRKEIFNSEIGSRMICSQFIVEVLKEVGVELFADKASSTIRPYDFVRSKLLRFVRRGKFR